MDCLVWINSTAQHVPPNWELKNCLGCKAVIMALFAVVYTACLHFPYANVKVLRCLFALPMVVIIVMARMNVHFIDFPHTLETIGHVYVCRFHQIN